MREKTVIQLFNSGPPAGTKLPEQFAAVANRAFQNAGITVKTLPPHRWPWNPFAKMHNAYRGLDPLRALDVLINHRNADLICGHLESCVLILLARRLFGFRVPVLIWEVPWSIGWRYREMVARLAIPRAEGCVVFSRNQISVVHDKYGADVPVIFQQFHIDTEFYSPRPPRTPQRRIVWSCGVDDGRDFALLLAVSKNIDADFRMKIPKSLDVPAAEHPNVTVERGFIPPDEFRQQYADASVVVVCTKETINAGGVTSLMEAMAMGRPTIVSDNPSLRDYFAPDDAVLIVPVGDAGALEAAITYVLDNPDAAEAMGRKARLFAEQWFGAARHYDQMAQLYLAEMGRPA